VLRRDARHVFVLSSLHLSLLSSHCPCDSAVPCRAVPCRAVPCRAVPCRAVPLTVVCADFCLAASTRVYCRLCRSSERATRTSPSATGSCCAVVCVPELIDGPYDGRAVTLAAETASFRTASRSSTSFTTCASSVARCAAWALCLCVSVSVSAYVSICLRSNHWLTSPSSSVYLYRSWRVTALRC
jgi:hypothetical protein